MRTPIHTSGELGAAIRRQRKRQRMRQDELAALVDSSHVFLRDVERGKPTVQLGRVLRLLDELGLRLYLDEPEAALPVGATFKLHRNPDGRFYFTLHASNDRRLLRGEFYASKASALVGIERMQAHAPNEERYVRQSAATSRDQVFRFSLTAPNGQTVAVSQDFATESARDGAIEVVKAIAPTAVILVETDESRTDSVD